MVFEKDLDIEYFRTDGADLFTPIFKNTIYTGTARFSVCNNDTLDREDMMFVPCEYEPLEKLE